jgi:hypothetical protein
LPVFSANISTKAFWSGEERKTYPEFSAIVQSAGTEIEKLLEGCLYSFIAGKAGVGVRVGMSGVGVTVGCDMVVGALTAMVAVGAAGVDAPLQAPRTSPMINKLTIEIMIFSFFIIPLQLIKIDSILIV